MLVRTDAAFGQTLAVALPLSADGCDDESSSPPESTTTTTTTTEGDVGSGSGGGGGGGGTIDAPWRSKDPQVRVRVTVDHPAMASVASSSSEDAPFWFYGPPIVVGGFPLSRRCGSLELQQQ